MPVSLHPYNNLIDLSRQVDRWVRDTSENLEEQLKAVYTDKWKL